VFVIAADTVLVRKAPVPLGMMVCAPRGNPNSTEDVRLPVSPLPLGAGPFPLHATAFMLSTEPGARTGGRFGDSVPAGVRCYRIMLVAGRVKHLGDESDSSGTGSYVQLTFAGPRGKGLGLVALLVYNPSVGALPNPAIGPQSSPPLHASGMRPGGVD
jgi:hypothetical protein